MEKLVGRVAESRLLQESFAANEAQLVAIYGRRRVGKTFLVRSVFANKILFEFSGAHHAGLKTQLANFSRELSKASGSAIPLAQPASWSEAFQQLANWLQPLLLKEKRLVFFDEFPWLDTSRSGFLSAFDYFWNTWAVKQKNLLLIICGSAASWMIKNIVHNKGGLHNRISYSIRLLPFTLSETEAYLKSRAIILDRYQIIQLYMAMGGIPHYLKNIHKGESAAQAIDRICFSKDGALREEFDKLYYSLFDEARAHLSIIRALAKRPKGLNRNEIIAASRLSSGGTTTLILKELEESGFITAYTPFQKAAKDALFKLTDEYSLFFLKYIENSRPAAGTWMRLSATASWRSWSGFAFEAICLKHTQALKVALGIAGVQTSESVWRDVSEDDGVQIDLLIDRADYCINLCEIKFSDTAYTITKSYAEALQKKKELFKRISKTRKTVFITMITSFGLVDNAHSVNTVDITVDVKGLFE